MFTVFMHVECSPSRKKKKTFISKYLGLLELPWVEDEPRFVGRRLGKEDPQGPTSGSPGGLSIERSRMFTHSCFSSALSAYLTWGTP